MRRVDEDTRQRIEFSRNLTARLLDVGMNQSDLARAIWGLSKNTTDHRGYLVQYGRDRVSSYVRGKALPVHATLLKIADVLKCAPGDLLPGATTLETSAKTIPKMAIHDVPNKNGYAFVQINQEMPLHVAMKIGALLAETTT